jgi:sugar phosphate isomerase/epimerase
MVFGMSTACFFRRHITEDAVVRIGEMGIRHAEVFLCCASEYKRGYIAELNRRLQDAGISVCSVHALAIQFEPQLFTSYARAKKDAFAVLGDVLEAARLLGARSYTFHGPANIKRISNRNLDYAKFADDASLVAEKAREYGVRLAWENVHWGLFSDIYFLNRLLSSGVSDNLFFTLDIKQSVLAGVMPWDFAKAMGKRLANVHICDYRRDEDGIRTALPFEGELDFNSLKASLLTIGYEGPLIYEVYASDYRNESQLLANYRKTRAFFMDGAGDGIQGIE